MEANTLEDISLNVSATEINEIKETVTELHTEIVEEIEVSTLPETVFKEFFLDFFRSAGQMNTEAPLTLKWVELAGGPYNEVSIVDDNNIELFKVPGLYSTPNSDLVNTDFNKTLGDFQLRTNRLPVDGLNYLTHKLTGVDASIEFESDDYVIRWTNIFKRYEEDTSTDVLGLPKSNINNTGTGFNDDVTDMFDYD